MNIKCQLTEGRLLAALELLEQYEAWEAEVISDNRCWEPEGTASRPTLTHELWDKLIALQNRRNQVLQRLQYSDPPQ